MFVLTITGVQYLAYASMINAGTFQDTVAQAAATGVDTSALQKIPEMLMDLTPLAGLVGIYERVFGMLLHVGLSIIVFYAVKKSKTKFYILAVILHTLFDVPAAFYQYGTIKNIYMIEALITVYAVVSFVIIYRRLYKKDVRDDVVQNL